MISLHCLRTPRRRTLAVLVACSCMISSAPAVGQQAEPTRPNVLLVITDDQRNGQMRFLDEVRDRLIQRGRYYSNAYVTTPLCCPSRGSIFSGKYAHNHGIDGNAGGNGVDEFKLKETWPAVLRDAGYKTGLTGKFLNGWPSDVRPRIFDFFNWPDRSDAHRLDMTQDEIRARDALRFLGRQEDNDARPWAFTLSLHAPHGPYKPPRKYLNWSPGPFPRNPGTEEEDISDKALSVRRNQEPDSQIQYRWDGQARTLRAADDQIARILSRLNRLDERRETLVVFVSDNGYMMGEHGLSQKTWPYLPSVGVPLIVRWPGHIEPGSRSDALVANIDLASTIFEAAGTSPDYTVDGRSLLSGAERQWLFLEGPRQRPESPYDPWDAYLDHDQHYIDWEDTTGWQEFYDRNTDPFETSNLLTDQDPSNDGGAVALRALIDAARVCQGGGCP